MIHTININNILHSCLSLTTIQYGTPLRPPRENEESHLHELRFHPHLPLLKFINKLQTDPLLVPARPVLINLHFIGTFCELSLNSQCILGHVSNPLIIIFENWSE